MDHTSQITLPETRQQPDLPPASNLSRTTSGTSKQAASYNILLIEDDLGTIEKIKNTLRNNRPPANVSLRLSKTLSSGIKQIQKHSFDVILLDLSMPETKGMDTLDKLQTFINGLPIVVLLESYEILENLSSEQQAQAKDSLLKSEIAGPLLFQTLSHAIERHRLETELKAAQKLCHRHHRLESLGMLANRIAHDFNNLLAGIAGNADLIAMQKDTASYVKDHLEGIIDGCQEGEELCDQLLHYSGKTQLSRSVIDVNSLIKDMNRALSPAFAKNAKISFQLQKSILPIEVDVSKIWQVIMNFIKNAVDSLEGNDGSVVLKTGNTTLNSIDQKQNYWGPEIDGSTAFTYLEIQDSGCGIPAEDIHHIFDPFFSTKTEGKGLGLSTSIGIIQAHAIGLKVTSRIGQGTSFTLLFPQSQKELPQEAKEAESNTDLETEGFVLVADDNPRMRNILNEYLKVLGFQTLLAPSGFETLEAYKSHTEDVSLVLLDTDMPGMDGETTYKHIIEIDPDAKVIVMSGYDSFSHGCKFANQKHIEFLKKPFRLNDLKNAIKKTLSS